MQRVAQQERSQRSVQEDNDKGGLCWTEAREGIARRMLKHLEDSGIRKSAQDNWEEQVLSPNEPRINTVRIARQARNEKREKLFQIFRQGENEVLIASKARWDEQFEGLGGAGEAMLNFQGRWSISAKDKKLWQIWW